MAPNDKNSDAGNMNMTKRSDKVLPLNEKVKVFGLIRKEKILPSQIAKIYGKSKSIWEHMKNKRKFVLVLLLHPKMQKLWPQCMISA